MKQCVKCGTLKSVTEFHKDSTKSDGLYPKCKACRKDDSKAYYLNNRDRLLSQSKVYQQKHKEKLREYFKDYYKNNSEKRKKNTKEWQQKNKERVREHRRNTKRKYPHKVAANTRKRKASLLNRTPDWLSKKQLQKMEDVYWLAKDLEKVSGQKYHVDHIVPLQGKDVCGLHVPWNLQVLPSDINEKKGVTYNNGWE